jgi:hypothetical protein
MSSVDFCAWQLHFNCHCSISMSASRQCRPRPTRSNRAIGGGSLRRSCVEEMCVNVGEVDLEAKATSSTSRVTCMAAPMHILPRHRANVNVTLIGDVGWSQPRVRRERTAIVPLPARFGTVREIAMAERLFWST